ncbi:SAUR-like auxin-responsive protein family [Prunus dulcis]|uniref:SAUR-like auxin-responsive protein family n=2 Tax=Prunus dulcis TaxID=3755 RepID=A0A4Y1RZT7_PRUDU|nr:SAUR-like auxin-responsive protein family [Prunus dulcis]
MSMNIKVMGFRLPGIVHAKRSLIRSLSSSSRTAESKTLDIPKGYFAVYVGKSQKKRFVIPVSYLNETFFLDLLSQAEEEFGYDHPMGGITIPCSEDTFLHLTSCLSV